MVSSAFKEKYASLISRSKVNNLAFDILGDLGLTLGFASFTLAILAGMGFISEGTLLSLNFLDIFFRNCGAAALMFFLVSTVMGSKGGKDSRKNAFYYMILGTLFYLMAIGIYLVLGKDDAGSATDSANALFPDNYLFSIASFYFLYYFLFTAPPKKKDGSEILLPFRLLSLIPLLYILLSHLFSALSSLNVLSISYFATAAFSGQYFLQEVAGLLVIYHFYFAGLKRKKRQDILSYDPFEQNSVLFLAVFLMATLEVILFYTLPSDIVSAFGIGKTAWCYLLLPFIAFFHNDDSESRHPIIFKLVDWYYTFAYILLGIVYVTIIVLAFSGSIK